MERKGEKHDVESRILTLVCEMGEATKVERARFVHFWTQSDLI